MRKNPGLSRLFNLLVFAFLYAPILVLVIFSFNDSKNRTVWKGFTLDWYRELFQNDLVIDALITTVEVSLLAAVLATILGTMAAIGFFAMRRRTRTALMSVNNIPMTNADIITGVSMMLLFVFFGSVLLPNLGLKLGQLLGADGGFDWGFHLGFGTLLIAHVTFNIPYVILSVLPCLRQLDKNLSEAAQDLGATPTQAFFKVIFPMLRPGIVNGAIIAFTMSIDDFVISYFTAGSQVSNLAMVVYSMARRRISPEINAISTLLFVSVLTLLIITNIRAIRQEQAEARRLQALRRDSLR